MSTAKMTLIGMYNYDNTIFNEMVLPAGIDADLFRQSLLMEKGEMEVLYPNPQFMKGAVKIWSLKWYDTFKKWLKGVEADWNPIYNYDRFEEGWDDQHKRYESLNKADYSDTRTTNLKDTRTADLEENRIANLKDEQTKNLKDESLFNNADVTSQTKEGTTEHKVAAYDSSTYQESSMDIINNGDSKTSHLGTVTNESTGTDTMAHTGTDAVTTKGTDEMAHSGTDEMLHKGTLSDMAGKEQNTNQHTAHLYGNIGVTTSSAMVAEWYAISKWNIFEHMADVFCSELLIPVY